MTERDGIQSRSEKNSILYDRVPHNPLRQERNAALIHAAVPPLPGALIKLETNSAPDQHGASAMPRVVCGQVQTTSGRFLRTAHTANQHSVSGTARGDSITSVRD